MVRAGLLRTAAAQLGRTLSPLGAAATGGLPFAFGLQPGCLPSLLLAEHVATRSYWAAAAAAAPARSQAAPLGVPPAAVAAVLGRRHETTPAAQQCLLDRTLLIDTLDTVSG